MRGSGICNVLRLCTYCWSCITGYEYWPYIFIMLEGTRMSFYKCNALPRLVLFNYRHDGKAKRFRFLEGWSTSVFILFLFHLQQQKINVSMAVFSYLLSCVSVWTRSLGADSSYTIMVMLLQFKQMLFLSSASCAPHCFTGWFQSFWSLDTRSYFWLNVVLAPLSSCLEECFPLWRRKIILQFLWHLFKAFFFCL